jgi:hypothetical protein
MTGKVFIALEFQFSSLPLKIMLKNWVLTTQRQMGLPDFALNSTAARTLSCLDTRYSAWIALYSTMRNYSSL